MSVIFSPRFRQDFQRIVDFIVARNPQAAARISAEIESAIDQLIGFPHTGQTADYGNARRLVTRKYGYLIYYSIDANSDLLEILTVTHGRQERPFQDD